MSGSGSDPAGAPSRWADLLPRTLSAVVMLALGGMAIHLGGLTYALFVSTSIGAVVWEILRMYRKEAQLIAIGCGAAAGLALLAASVLPVLLVPVVLAVPLMLAWIGMGPGHRSSVAVAAWALFGGFGLIWLRDSYWVGWTFWLIFVVVATDVAGYFCGKYFGGRKFWPAVSPKKTWSGTAGGWGAAAMAGLICVMLLGLPGAIIWISVLVSMASQAGDIAESALKRQKGVKDSSQLIPGHGGVFDRFDGMLGAGGLCFLVAITLG